jgi:hypothetical protein
VGEALRQFFPGSGTVHFGDEKLDLFALDRALLELAGKVTSATEQLASTKVGPYTYGSFRQELFDHPDDANGWVRDWLHFRAKHGDPIEL